MSFIVGRELAVAINAIDSITVEHDGVRLHGGLAPLRINTKASLPTVVSLLAFIAKQKISLTSEELKLALQTNFCFALHTDAKVSKKLQSKAWALAATVWTEEKVLQLNVIAYKRQNPLREDLTSSTAWHFALGNNCCGVQDKLTMVIEDTVNVTCPCCDVRKTGKGEAFVQNFVKAQAFHTQGEKRQYSSELSQWWEQKGLTPLQAVMAAGLTFDALDAKTFSREQV